MAAESPWEISLLLLLLLVLLIFGSTARGDFGPGTRLLELSTAGRWRDTATTNGGPPTLAGAAAAVPLHPAERVGVAAVVWYGPIGVACERTGGGVACSGLTTAPQLESSSIKEHEQR